MFFLQVEAGKYLNDPRDGLRRRDVDGGHAAVGDCGMQNLRDIRALIAQVVRIFGAADHFIVSVDARYLFPYIHHALLLFIAQSRRGYPFMWRSMYSFILRYPSRVITIFPF